MFSEAPVWCFVPVVLGQSDFLSSSSSSSSSAWPHSELTLDEDTSGLDYMLALSLQSDGESMAGGVEGNLWSGIWDHKIDKNTSVNSPLSPPNNNYPNFTTGTSALQDHDQAGKGWNGLRQNTWCYSAASLLILLNCLHRYHAAMWVLRRALSWRGPHSASG